MKKQLIAILLCCVFLGTGLVNAEEIDFMSLAGTLNEGETYINGEVWNNVAQLQDVGNGWLLDFKDENGSYQRRYNENGAYQRYFTEDFIGFRPVWLFKDTDISTHSRAGYMDEIKWADGVYLARSNPYDSGKPGKVFEQFGYLYILDTDFQLVKKIEFDWYVREMSYIDGVYYVRIWNERGLRANHPGYPPEAIVDLVYSSRDLENWETESELQHVPVTNGSTVLTLKDEKLYTFVDGKIGNQIVYEEAKVKEVYSSYFAEAEQVLNVVGEYFYLVNNDGDVYSGWLSMDGVYYTKFYFDTTGIVNGAGAFVGKYSGDPNFYVPKSTLDQYLKQGDTYVQVNDKILGFETPPVMENDRTLVPMRFLFEQLGAEVSWDETTNTATAVIPADVTEQLQTFGMAQEKSVSFSIDNTTATVNGETAAMDVPARLVNDKTMVPLRFLSENLGYTVTWNEAAKTAAVIDPAGFSADRTEHPELSGMPQAHYVIYQEGHRNGRIELALFDIADGSAQSLVKRGGALELSDNSKYQNDSKWYWQEGKWVPFEEGYERISNNAVSVIASDLPVTE